MAKLLIFARYIVAHWPIGILAQFSIEIIHEIFKIYYQTLDWLVCLCLQWCRAKYSKRSSHSSFTLSLIKKCRSLMCVTPSGLYPRHIFFNCIFCTDEIKRIIVAFRNTNTFSFVVVVVVVETEVCKPP